MMVSENSHLRP